MLKRNHEIATFSSLSAKAVVAGFRGLPTGEQQTVLIAFHTVQVLLIRNVKVRALG